MVEQIERIYCSLARPAGPAGLERVRQPAAGAHSTGPDQTSSSKRSWGYVRQCCVDLCNFSLQTELLAEFGANLLPLELCPLSAGSLFSNLVAIDFFGPASILTFDKLQRRFSGAKQEH